MLTEEDKLARSRGSAVSEADRAAEVLPSAAGSWDVLSEFSSLFLQHGLTAQVSAWIVREVARPQYGVLVIGSGTGACAVPFAEAGCAVLGVDRSRRMVEHCRARDIPCVEADARELPPGVGPFELVVIATGVLDCMSDQQGLDVLREAHRVARPAGVVAVAHFDHSSDGAFYDRWNLAVSGRLWTSRKVGLWRATRAYEISERDLRLREMVRFYDALASAAKEKGVALADVLAALPAFQAVRSVPDIAALLNRAGWRPLRHEQHEASRVVVVLAERGRVNALSSERAIVDGDIEEGE